MIRPTFRKAEIHEKKWGHEKWLANNEKYCGKLLVFKKNSKFSMHFHKEKEESFFVLTGKIRFSYFDLSNASKVFLLCDAGMCIDIPQCCPHQVEALEDSTIIEVSTHHDDNDSYRIEKGDSQ